MEKELALVSDLASVLELVLVSAQESESGLDSELELAKELAPVLVLDSELASVPDCAIYPTHPGGSWSGA